MRIEQSICVVCGKQIEQTGRGRPRKYCDEHRDVAARKPALRRGQESRWTDPILKAKILQLVNDGLTLEEIGEEFNMTRERARQIIDRMGLRDHFKLRREQVKAERQARQESWLRNEILKRVEQFNGNGTSVLHEIVEESGIRPEVVSTELRKLGILLPVTGGSTGHPEWTYEDMVGYLQEVASHYPDNGVNAARYKEHAKPDWPSWQTYHSSTRFASAQEACDMAGVEYVKKVTKRVYERIPEQDFIDAIVEYANAALDAGQRPTFDGLTRYCQDNDLPSAASVRKRHIPYTEIFQQIAAQRVQEKLNGG